MPTIQQLVRFERLAKLKNITSPILTSCPKRLAVKDLENEAFDPTRRKYIIPISNNELDQLTFEDWNPKNQEITINYSIKDADYYASEEAQQNYLNFFRFYNPERAEFHTTFANVPIYVVIGSRNEILTSEIGVDFEVNKKINSKFEETAVSYAEPVSSDETFNQNMLGILLKTFCASIPQTELAKTGNLNGVLAFRPFTCCVGLDTACKIIWKRQLGMDFPFLQNKNEEKNGTHVKNGMDTDNERLPLYLVNCWGPHQDCFPGLGNKVERYRQPRYNFYDLNTAMKKLRGKYSITRKNIKITFFGLNPSLNYYEYQLYNAECRGFFNLGLIKIEPLKKFIRSLEPWHDDFMSSGRSARSSEIWENAIQCIPNITPPNSMFSTVDQKQHFSYGLKGTARLIKHKSRILRRFILFFFSMEEDPIT